MMINKNRHIVKRWRFFILPSDDGGISGGGLIHFIKLVDKGDRHEISIGISVDHEASFIVDIDEVICLCLMEAIDPCPRRHLSARLRAFELLPEGF